MMNEELRKLLVTVSCIVGGAVVLIYGYPIGVVLWLLPIVLAFLEGI